MLGEEKNLKNLQKDSIKDPSSVSVSYGDTGSHSGLYPKTDKLITALYMVTDIIDKDEPLRNKLRTLGVEILSDISTLSMSNMSKPAFDILKIDQVLSFLDIASAIGIISEMNCSILRKEFSELYKSIKEFTGNIRAIDKQINLSEFFREPARNAFSIADTGGELSSQGHYFNGHHNSTRIGVQKGSTLLKALSGVQHPTVLDFDILKKQRRNDIINILKTIGGNATIKDIKDKAQASQGEAVSFMSCNEKTLQRERVSMVKDNVLNKVGEKRWSRY